LAGHLLITDDFERTAFAMQRCSGVMTSGTTPAVAIILRRTAGGALGAYQARVYEALSEAGIEPNWIAGMSIGAIDAAIIAGNPPDIRIQRLHEFWTHVTADGPWSGAAHHFVAAQRRPMSALGLGRVETPCGKADLNGLGGSVFRA
jgi:predicted acylesterase/phospholipase RssA